jgi:hypothetical protein
VYDDDDDFWESDREVMHEAARMAGTTPSGVPLPRTTDKHGRVWVTCTCGGKFLLTGRPETAGTHEPLDPEIAAAIVEELGDEDW